MKAPLKTVLKNFLDHVENLEARQMLNDDQYETEFQELKKLTDKLKEDPAYPCSFGLKDVNRPKNRYKDIVPYDISRVILPKHEGIPGSDYINASYIKGASGALAYIAAQGPLPNTVIDFWRMIWICDVQVVVMACNEKEAGKFKCEAYWPVPGKIKQYGNISVELIDTSQVCPDFLVRKLLVTCGSELRDVYQFHYTSWPDHGVPETVQPILDLVRLMRDCQASETVPIVVHCSAGCGRTGTICAVDYVWACLRHGKLDEDFSLYQIALELRRQRIAMIQTKEQYILAHKAVAAMFEQQLKVIDNHIYENLDEDGEPLIWKEVGKDKELIQGREFDVRDFMKTFDTKEKKELTLTDINKTLVESKNDSKFITPGKIPEPNVDTISRNSSVGNSLNMKLNAVDGINSSSKNSESSYSRNSILSQHSTEDSIPFIDEDEVCVRPNCGRAYLDIPSCDSITKLVNCFDPFVDKLSVGTDDSSPEGDPTEVSIKMKDFQSLSMSRTLDKNTKIPAFKDNKQMVEQNIEQDDSKSDIIDLAKKSLLLNNRGSYPPCSNSERLQERLSDVVEREVSGNSDGVKKVGKATVVRRPSISKLKALFEKSGISSQKCPNDGSKRLLFRNNSHHVSRAGSAPPSLDCMDKSSAVEKESILKMVTRKFRSSSVRTEREIQSKQLEKTLNRRSATETVKDGFNALTRTMSFNINKTFKSYSPAKMKQDSISQSSTSNPCDSVAGIYKPKSPDQPKGNSMWYDKSSLPRAVAIVKPTGKFEAEIDSKSEASKSPDKSKTTESHFSYVTKPAKLKDFFSSLNKKDAKDPTTLWYNNDPNADTPLNSDRNSSDSSKLESTNVHNRSSNKVLPFLPIVPWKKVGQKSPLSSPESPKNFNEPTTPRSSTFYTSVLQADSANCNQPNENSSAEVPKCPVPEEIIPLNLDSSGNSFWPSNSVSSSTFHQNSSEKSDSNISVNKDSLSEQSVETDLTKNESELKKQDNILKHSINNELVKKLPKVNRKDDVPKQSVNPELENNENNAHVSKHCRNSEITKIESDAKCKNDVPKNSLNVELIKNKSDASNDNVSNLSVNTVSVKSNDLSKLSVTTASVNTELGTKTASANDVRPAIPKKMVIGKNKNFQNFPLDKNFELQHPPVVQKIDDSTDKSNTEIKSTEQGVKTNIDEKNELYINVNIKALKNIEQIENVLRKNPRGAIIDLTSRESYSMEEELVHAVNQLSESPGQSKAPVMSTQGFEKSKTLGAKTNSKFPGYEVIWPEQPCIPVQKSKSNSKVPLIGKNKPSDKSTETLISNQIKTGLCYSPPLRRSANASMSLAKSQSCGNLDWSEPDEPISNLKEHSNTPTKKLVNEAVVELNTLLNQLTTRTLSEDMDFDVKSKEKLAVSEEAHKKEYEKPKECNIAPNDTVVHSVTLVTKSYNSGSSPKEEEIVFHFPPPPRVPPPPKDESSVESFNIVCKDGSVLVNKPLKDTSIKPLCVNGKGDSGLISDPNTSTSSDNSLNEVSLQKFPQPAPRKSKQTGELRRSSSYSNISPPQDKNKGYENVFLEKYQTLSRLEIKPEPNECNVLDKVVPFENSSIMSKSLNAKIPPNYVNVGDMHCTEKTASLKTKQEAFLKAYEFDKGKGMVKNVNHSVPAPNNPVSHDKFIIKKDSKGGDSIYGKIYKISDKNIQSTENLADTKTTSSLQDLGEAKKKLLHSKKTERAPLPPNLKPVQVVNNEISSKISPNSSMIPKKLPSRKLEKAPPPPHLLQKSSSAISVPKKNLQGPPPYVNFPPAHQVEEKPKLPAVRENVPNVTDTAQVVNKNINTSVVHDKFVNRGLSHSQSDVSVYLALKERRIQSANQERKILNMKSLLMNKRVKTDPTNMSSSDSDSSYERIFLTKNNDPKKTVSKNAPKEQIEQISVKSYRKEVPVAPPRSKRRTTTEVQYTKVKAKDVSQMSLTSELLEETDIKNSKSNSSTSEDDPPAIPMKTKDAFEVPEGGFPTDMNKKN